MGGLHLDLTEGDVIAIFSQLVKRPSSLPRIVPTPDRYGEVMDVNLPRDKTTGKTRGFGFLMYEDQRSTVLAVDNLNGAKVLERTLRVDHVKNYKQPKIKGEDGEWIEPEEQSLNAKPEMIIGMSQSPIRQCAANISIVQMRHLLLIQKRLPRSPSTQKIP